MCASEHNIPPSCECVLSYAFEKRIKIVDNCWMQWCSLWLRHWNACSAKTSVCSDAVEVSPWQSSRLGKQLQLQARPTSLQSCTLGRTSSQIRWIGHSSVTCYPHLHGSHSRLSAPAFKKRESVSAAAYDGVRSTRRWCFQTCSTIKKMSEVYPTAALLPPRKAR